MSSVGDLRIGAALTNVHEFRSGQRTFTPIAPGRVRLVQEEAFRGVAVPFMRGWLHSQALPAFEALNAALLRDRAETLYP